MTAGAGSHRPPLPPPGQQQQQAAPSLFSPKHDGLTLSQLNKQQITQTQAASTNRRSSVARRNSLDYVVDCGSKDFKHLSLGKV